MSAPDPIELLSRIAPLSDEEAAALFGTMGRERLLEAITRLSPRAARRNRRRVRRPLVLAIAVLVAIGMTAVAWAITRGGARETTSIDCVIAGVDSGIDATSGNPAADCAAEWQRERGTPAPALVAYANSYGGVTVLPRSKKPPAGWRTLHSQDVALIELQESLDDYLNGLNSTCFTSAQATAFTREQLYRLGFAGWTVNIRSISASTSSKNSPTVTAENGSGARPAPAMSTAGAICTSSELVDPTTTTVTLISSPYGNPPPNWLPGRLATSLRPLTKTCLSLPAMRRAVEQRASRLGLSPSPPLTGKSYDLNVIKDDKQHCTTVYQTVEGGISLILRGARS
jgi:hypothetical protein